MIPPANFPNRAARESEKSAKRSHVTGRCVCGDVVIALDFPAFWAWHDHSSATRHAHGAAYATYVGAWKSRVRVLKGEARLACFENVETGTSRSFCRRCGTPIFYKRPHAPRWINIPRALFPGARGANRATILGLPKRPNGNIAANRLCP